MVVATGALVARLEIGEDGGAVAAGRTDHVEGGVPALVGCGHVGILPARISGRGCQTRRVPTTVCERCGFRADDYAARDLATAASWLRGMTDQTVADVDDDVLAGATLAGTLAELRATIDRLDRTADPQPDVSGVHDALHLLRLLGRQLHDVGAGAPTQHGTVAQISTSDGGVPKVAVSSADIGPRGVLGDRQADRKHHGRPFQALCLWSTDVIDALRAEGHPIHPGAAGENLTVSGLDWSAVRPGVRLRVGSVLLEVTYPTSPCRKNARWFIDGDFNRMHDSKHPGWSRMYARVLEEGLVRTGDPVEISKEE